MGCCGQKRAALRTRHAVAITPPRDSAPPPPDPDERAPEAVAGEVAVAYRGAAAALLHRGASGRLYTFSHARRIRGMAPHDAAQLALREDFELLPQEH